MQNIVKINVTLQFSLIKGVTILIQHLIFNCHEIKQNVHIKLINLFLLDIYLLIIK